MSIDQNCNIKPEEYLNLIENELDELCKQSNKIQNIDSIINVKSDYENEETNSELDSQLESHLL